MTAQDHGISAVSLDSVDRWITAVRAIPPAARVYDVTPRRAELEFGITSAVADLLTDRGLPRAAFDGEPRFSWNDLHYIALRLGSARIYLRTLRSWAHSLAEAAPTGSRMVWLRYRTYAHPGSRVVIGPDHIAATLNVRMTNHDSAFPPGLQRTLHQAAALDFCILPESLSGDIDFARRTGLTDCATASRIVARECEQQGIEARMAFGLIVAPPLGTPHEWVEIRMGDVWVPADPLLLSVLGQFAGLDSTRWSCAHSPSVVLLRLADRNTPIVDAAGGSVETSFMVNIDERSSRPDADGQIPEWCVDHNAA
jgi:transglutaminase superfamily protein